MFTQFFVLFSLMGIGFIVGHLGGIDGLRNEGIGQLLLQVATPALLVTSAFSLDIQEQLLLDFLVMLALCFCWFGLFAGLAWVYTRIYKKTIRNPNMVILSLFTSNNGFMGFPIAIAFFGDKGLLFMVAHNLGMNILLFSFGVYLLRRSGPEGNDVSKRHPSEVIKQILNPNIVAVFVGIGISIFGLASGIPGPVHTVLDMLADLAIPLSMMYIGITLAGSKLSMLFHDQMIVRSSLVRLTIFPSIVLGLCLVIPIPRDMAQILFMAAMLPTAATVPVMTGIYAQSGQEEATKIVLFSTILSLITAPLGVYLATFFFSGGSALG